MSQIKIKDAAHIQKDESDTEFQGVDIKAVSQATEVVDVDDKTSQRSSSRGESLHSSVKASKRQIILLSLAVLGPMFAFTCTFLWLIFGHIVNPNACLHQQLCLSEAQLNPSVRSSDYVVDFPAAQLVFIASWSSTVSFTLIGFSMALYSYVVASSWMDLSDIHSPRRLPTPYQTSVLLRVINTEPLVLISILWQKMKDLFVVKRGTKRSGYPRSSNTPPVLRNSIAIFVACAATSLLIQAADTYLHVVTEAINFNQVQTEPANNHLYSRGLSPECLERPTFGDLGNPNYWGCGLDRFGKIPTIGPVNLAEFQATTSGISRHHDIWRHVDKSGSGTSVIVPKAIDGNVDYHATSFGVSTQCRALYPQSCQQSLAGNLTRFNCTKERGGIDMTFTMFRIKYQAYYYKWHQFVEEPGPFIGREAYEATDTMWKQAANLSDAAAGEVFSNPWQSLVQLNVNSEVVDRTKEPIYYMDDLYSSSVLFVSCNTTVFDVDYTAVKQNITSITRAPSNSSTTGIISMTTLTMWKFFGAVGSSLVDELNYLGETEDDIVGLYARKISDKYAAVLAAQTSPRAAILVQSRTSKVFSRIPKAAVWIQLITNMVFMALGVAISVAAFLRAKNSPGVHQVQLRLSIMGLAAHAFEGAHARRPARNNDELFEERDGEPGRLVKRVALEKSVEGGSTFVLREGWEECGR